MKIAFTGGHHSSALPVIAELFKRDPTTNIIWFGHRHSLKGDTNDTLEYKEITALNIKFYELQTGKVYKNLSLRNFFKIVNSIVFCFSTLKKEKPDLVMSFGGYLAAPVVLAAWFLGIPVVTHEQTLVVGYANKVISYFAKSILVSWKESLAFFPKHKTKLVGLPLRTSIFEVQSSNFEFGNSLPVLYITAGKTGSHIINKVVLECLEKLLTSYNVIHQCGDYSITNDYESLEAAYKKITSDVSGKYYLRRFVFENEIGEIFSKCDLVLSRAGAHITAELLELKKKCVLIPIPWVSHNEQNINANYLSSVGLGLVLQESELTTETLLNALSVVSHLDIANSLKSLGDINSSDYSKPAKLICDEIYEQVKIKTTKG